MATRYFALIAGIVYLLVGIAGFIPGFVSSTGAATPDLAVDQGFGYLFGLFPVNILHNIVHLLVGVLGIAAYRSWSNAQRFSQGLAIFYGLLAVMGLIPLLNLNTTFGLIPLFSHDIWLHALTAIVAAVFGFTSIGQSSTAPKPSDSRTVQERG
jgi:hypothetical protein